MTEVAKQISWIWNLLSELKFKLLTVPLYVDNQGAIFLASNPAQEGCTKHIEILEHYIRECIHDGKIKLHICTIFPPINRSRIQYLHKESDLAMF